MNNAFLVYAKFREQLEIKKKRESREFATEQEAHSYAQQLTRVGKPYDLYEATVFYREGLSYTQIKRYKKKEKIIPPTPDLRTPEQKEADYQKFLKKHRAAYEEDGAEEQGQDAFSVWQSRRADPSTY